MIKTPQKLRVFESLCVALHSLKDVERPVEFMLEETPGIHRLEEDGTMSVEMNRGTHHANVHS